ncbi:hypothetical protein FIBSPDRAFT_956660 [Athelia psychrophila]|uniref:Uncharacterized protein n=1 Tax=Athelia psychrophila TaxID=1759441 RepID=A0A166GRY1_9AGAM|nr:hypothetical protein FIBSPDRAFT_956660 [Fibularhizoctonia sp. CBS 109695]
MGACETLVRPHPRPHQRQHSAALARPATSSFRPRRARAKHGPYGLLSLIDSITWGPTTHAPPHLWPVPPSGKPTTDARPPPSLLRCAKVVRRGSGLAPKSGTAPQDAHAHTLPLALRAALARRRPSRTLDPPDPRALPQEPPAAPTHASPVPALRPRYCYLLSFGIPGTKRARAASTFHAQRPNRSRRTTTSTRAPPTPARSHNVLGYSLPLSEPPRTTHGTEIARSRRMRGFALAPATTALPRHPPKGRAPTRSQNVWGHCLVAQLPRRDLPRRTQSNDSFVASSRPAPAPAIRPLPSNVDHAPS